MISPNHESQIPLNEEDTPTIIYTVERTGPTEFLQEELEVPLELVYPSGFRAATEGEDFTSVPDSVTFAPGQVSRDFAIQILDDDDVDTDTEAEPIVKGESFQIRVPGTATYNGHAGHRMTITDESDWFFSDWKVREPDGFQPVEPTHVIGSVPAANPNPV